MYVRTFSLQWVDSLCCTDVGRSFHNTLILSRLFHCHVVMKAVFIVDEGNVALSKSRLAKNLRTSSFMG